MSGIIDKKVKFIDLLLTQEGKRQLSSGKFRPTFASLTDKNIFYDKTDTSHISGSDRLYLQTPSKMPYDVVILEKDDSGKLIFSDLSEDFTILGDQIFKKVENASTVSTSEYKHASGSQFASTFDKITKTITDNFRNNKYIRTELDFDNQNKNFEISKKNHSFTISNSVPWSDTPNGHVVELNDADTFMFDSKLAHLKNFQFLPPINKDETKLGTYYDFRGKRRETILSIKNNLNVSKIGEQNPLENQDTVLNYLGDVKIKNRAPNAPEDAFISRELLTVTFPTTSKFNNFFLQIFEKNNSDEKILKLDVVDAGQFYDSEDSEKPNKHVFYVGKIMFDDLKVPTFINLFTIILD